MSLKKSRQTTGNIGLYYTCYELSKRGWNVMPTSRNARGTDIIAYSADGKRMITIEVKSLDKRNDVSLNPETTLSEFLVVCRNVYASPEVFITRIDGELKSNIAINTREKDGKISHWIKANYYELFKDNWDIIGKG